MTKSQATLPLGYGKLYHAIFENRSMRFARARIGTRPRHSLEQLEPSLRPDIAGEGFPAILIVIEPELVEPESVILMPPWQSVATASEKRR